MKDLETFVQLKYMPPSPEDFINGHIPPEVVSNFRTKVGSLIFKIYIAGNSGLPITDNILYSLLIDYHEKHGL